MCKGPCPLSLCALALDRLEVDAAGFDSLDRALLGTLIDKFSGGPVGLETLAHAVGEDKGTLEDAVEPFSDPPGLFGSDAAGTCGDPDGSRAYWRKR